MQHITRVVSCTVVAAAAIVTTPGCQGLPNCRVSAVKTADVEYVLAEYRIASQAARTVPAEVTDTPAYRVERPNIKKVAIRFPDSCHEAGAAEVTGKSNAGGTTIFKSRCGVWLGELERSLSGSGFIVYSSDAVHQLEKQGKSAYVAAAELGADLVIQFNSLEATDVKAGGLAGTRFLYFKSNEKGEELGPLALPDATRSYFRTFIKQRMEPKGAEPVVALAAILDATAILAKPMGAAAAGESIWFYRRSLTKPLESAGSMRFLFARAPQPPPAPGATVAPGAGGFGGLAGGGFAGGSAPEWLVAAPDIPAPLQPPPPPAASEDVSTSSSGDVVDHFAVQRLALVRESAGDFVARFAGKSK